MKKILFRKLLLDCLIFFSISLISSSIIVWVFQAVNFLDIMIEDGRDYLVYINYTLLNFPKIFSKILPFALFFSFTYVITRYELNNELIIFWSFGINKIELINFFIKTSLLLMMVQILLTSFLVPKSQELSRSLMRDSEVDFMEGFIKPKKFNDTIKGLTIYSDKKNVDGNLENIYLKKDMGENNFQITYSKNGKFVNRGTTKILELYNGQTINGINNKISNFNFTRSDFNLSKLETDVIKVNKMQETATLVLFNCLNELYKMDIDFIKVFKDEFSKHNCISSNLDNIFKELYKRFFIPFYIPVLILISLLLIVQTKESIHYFKFRIFIFLSGLFIIIFSESTLKFIEETFSGNIKIVLIPFLFFIFLYYPLFHNLKLKFKNKKFNNKKITI